MGCVIKYKGQSIPEEQFLQYLNKQIAINNLFNENESFANAVYEVLGVKPANISFNIEPFGKSIDNIDVIKDNEKIGYVQISKNNNTKTLTVTGIELKEKGFGKNVYLKLQQQYPDFTIKSDSKNLSESAIKMWDSLVNKQLATKEADKQYTLDTQQAQQLYSQYLDTIFPDSKVRDIVYHFSNTKIDKPDKEKFSLSANINRRKGFFGINKNVNPGNNFANVEGTISHAMLFNMKNPDFGDFSVLPPIVAKNETKDSAIIKQKGDINYYAVFEPEQIHILSSKADIQGFKDFVSKKINNNKADESINERLMRYEESIKIPNNVKSKVLEKIEKETEKVKEKLLSLGLKQDNNKFELITNSYATFKMKLKELENVNAIISTNKTSDFYQIIARLKNTDSTMELKKQGELPFTPIEVKQVIQEQQFLNDVADNVFEGLSEEEKQILKKKIENGDYDLNCRI